MRKLAAALAVCLALPARADEAPTTLEVVAYVTPAAVAALATAVNGTFAAYDEGAPLRWRMTGYISGGVELAIGALVLADRGDTTQGVILGTLPLVLGVAAITTAWLAPVPNDIVGVELVPGGAALVVAGRF